MRDNDGPVVQFNPDFSRAAIQAGTAALAAYIAFRAVRAILSWECGGCAAWVY